MSSRRRQIAQLQQRPLRFERCEPRDLMVADHATFEFQTYHFEAEASPHEAILVRHTGEIHGPRHDRPVALRVRGLVHEPEAPSRSNQPFNQAFLVTRYSDPTLSRALLDVGPTPSYASVNSTAIVRIELPAEFSSLNSRLAAAMIGGSSNHRQTYLVPIGISSLVYLAASGASSSVRPQAISSSHANGTRQPSQAQSIASITAEGEDASHVASASSHPLVERLPDVQSQKPSANLGGTDYTSRSQAPATLSRDPSPQFQAGVVPTNARHGLDAKETEADWFPGEQFGDLRGMFHLPSIRKDSTQTTARNASRYSTAGCGTHYSASNSPQQRWRSVDQAFEGMATSPLLPEGMIWLGFQQPDPAHSMGLSDLSEPLAASINPFAALQIFLSGTVHERIESRDSHSEASVEDAPDVAMQSGPTDSATLDDVFTVIVAAAWFILDSKHRANKKAVSTLRRDYGRDR